MIRCSKSDDERSGDDHATVFLCGAYRFSGDIGCGLLEAPPPWCICPADPDPLHDLIGLLSRQLATPEHEAADVRTDIRLVGQTAIELRTPAPSRAPCRERDRTAPSRP